SPRSSPRTAGRSSSSTNARLPFTRLVGREAPDFALLDQFGHVRRMSGFRHRVVLLTFVSSRCTDLCPLTALMLRRTEVRLGRAAAQTAVVAVTAETRHTAVRDVRQGRRLDAMTR